MHVLIAVFDSEDDAQSAQKRIEAYCEKSDLLTDLTDGSKVLVTLPDGTVVHEQEITDEEPEEEDEDDEEE